MAKALRKLASLGKSKGSKIARRASKKSKDLAKLSAQRSKALAKQASAKSKVYAQQASAKSKVYAQQAKTASKQASMKAKQFAKDLPTNIDKGIAKLEEAQAKYETAMGYYQTAVDAGLVPEQVRGTVGKVDSTYRQGQKQLQQQLQQGQLLRQTLTQPISNQYQASAVIATPEYQTPAVTATPEYQTPAVTATPEYQTVTATPEYQTVTATPEYQTVTATPEYQTVTATPEYQTTTPTYQTTTPTYQTPTVTSTPEYQTTTPTYQTTTPTYQTTTPTYQTTTPTYQSSYETQTPVSNDVGIGEVNTASMIGNETVGTELPLDVETSGNTTVYQPSVDATQPVSDISTEQVVLPDTSEMAILEDSGVDGDGTGEGGSDMSTSSRVFWGIVNSINPFIIMNLVLWPIVYVVSLLLIRYGVYQDIEEETNDVWKKTALWSLLATWLISVFANLIRMFFLV